MNCLILGGGGFIGSNLVDALLLNRQNVTVFEHPKAKPLIDEKTLNKIQYIKGDFDNPSAIEEAIKGQDVIFHLISTTLPATSNQNTVYDVKSNVISTLFLLELSVEHKIKKIVFSSSGGTVYGIPQSLPISENHPTNPICSYGICKLMIEKYLSLYHDLYGLEYSVLRFGNPYGERQRTENVQGVIPVFIKKVLLNEEIEIWGDGSITRDFLYISDLVSAMVKSYESSYANEIFNIAGGQPHSVLSILNTIENVTGIKPPIRFLPGRKLDVPDNYLDIRKAKKMLDWRPKVALEDGIKKTCEWVETQL